MGYIKIGKIKKTPNVAIKYCTENKVENLKEYTTGDKIGDKIVFKTINTAMYCSVENANNEWESIRKIYDKNDKILSFHIKQNFGLENMDANIAHEIGVKLAQKLFDDFQCIVSTHTNTKYPHNHIIFNSVSFKTGKKYYDTLASYKKLREVSDELCEEYGLPVIQHTKEFKLVKYKNENGKIKYFEPTERKSLIERGKISTKNDYRNSDAFIKKERIQLSNRDILKKDIDEVIKIVTSYDELIEKMKEIGYEVKSKKVNGDWLKNVSFKAINKDKFLRDSSLGEEYTREYLSAYFDNKYKNIVKDNSKIEENYQYKITDIDSLNEYRKNNANIKRSEVEMYIINDIKKLNKELDNKYWNSIKIEKKEKEPVLKNKRNQYLLDCINSNFKSLQFVEKKNIKSFNQINKTIQLLYEKRNLAQKQCRNIKNMLQVANETVLIIQKYNTLKVNENSVNKEDILLIQTYESILKERNLIDSLQQSEFIEKIQKYNSDFDKLSISLKLINNQIKEYDDCIYTINRIDKNGDKKYEEEINQYYKEKEKFKNER